MQWSCCTADEYATTAAFPKSVSTSAAPVKPALHRETPIHGKYVSKLYVRSRRRSQHYLKVRVIRAAEVLAWVVPVLPALPKCAVLESRPQPASKWHVRWARGELGSIPLEAARIERIIPWIAAV